MSDVQHAPCAGCGKVIGEHEAHIRKDPDPCMVFTYCPAWADGQHLFQAYIESSEKNPFGDGLMAMMGHPTQPTTNGVTGKRCACGATVERAK